MMMMMANGDWLVTVPVIRVGIGNLFRRQMDMSRMGIVFRLDQSDSGPFGCMGEIVPGLRQAVQVHGRQEGDTQTDADMAKGVVQISGLPDPFSHQPDPRQSACLASAGAAVFDALGPG